MNRLLLSLIILITICSCTRPRFEIDFDLADGVNSNYRVIYYSYGKKGGAVRETGAPVVNGKARVEGATTSPTLVWIFDRGQIPTVIYAGKGDKIKITGNTPSPAEWQVDGNEINEELSKWRNNNAVLLNGGDIKAVNSAIASFAAENPESEITPLLLLTTFSRTDDETLFRRLWQRLPDSSQKRLFTTLAARNDVTGNSVPTPGKLISAVMRSFHNGADTLCPSSARATLLYFWHNAHPGRSDAIDSIRVLAREFPDSSSRIIADICLDVDSMTWTAPLKRDSLENVARLWAPAGLADSRLMLLQVPGTAFFIVLSPDGNQIYRGTDFTSAAREFRQLASTAGGIKE